MPSLMKVCKNVLRLSGSIFLFTVPSFATGIGATATYTGTPDPTTAGVYDYALTLNNTGTTAIGTFWFSWIPGGDFLSPKPTNVGAPTGWTDAIFTSNATGGNSIRWVSSTNPLQAGQSLSGFSFDSTETPDQLLGMVPSGTGAGLPILTSVVYIGAPFADPGAQFVATATTPEPSSLIMLATGLLGGAGGVYRRFKVQTAR